MTEEPLACEIHARRRAIASCTGCNTPLCRSCRKVRRGEPWCFACALKSDGGPPRRRSDAPAAPEAASAGDVIPPPAVVPVSGPRTDAPTAVLPWSAPQPSQQPASPPPPPPASPTLPQSLSLPPPQRPPSPAIRLPIALYLVLGVQTVAIALLGVAIRRPASPPAPVVAPVASPTPFVAATAVRAPTLMLREGTVIRGAPVSLRGEASYGEFVAVIVDGETRAVGLVANGRFDIPDLALDPGGHTISVVAYRHPGVGVESAGVFVRYDAPLETGDPAGAIASPSPWFTPESAPPHVEAPAASRTPATHPVPLVTPAVVVEPRPSPGARNILRGGEGSAMALTFDGGSDASEAERILETLKRKGIRSTVFLTGEFIRSYPAVTRRIVADGHEVGNHTFHHPHLARWDNRRGHVTLPQVTEQLLLDELKATDRVFAESTGSEMSRYWRAPYGEINAEIIAWASAGGWTHVGWTQGLDTLDWVADPADPLYRSADEIRRRVVRAANAGAKARGGIVLMHLGSERRDDQLSHELPAMIDDLHSLGYRLVTVSTLLGS